MTDKNTSEYDWGEKPPSIDNRFAFNRNRADDQTEEKNAPFLPKG